MRYLMVFAFAASLAAQEKLVETIEVKVVNIDVVVTDRAGHPVTGLTRDDFEVFENGKPQPITNFYEVRPDTSLPASITTAPTAAAPQLQAVAPPDDVRARRFVICLDNYSLQPAQRNSVLAAVKKFIDTNMKPGDEASLIVWAKRIEVVTPLTNDRAEIQRGIDTIAGRSRVGLSAADEEERRKQECIGYIQEVDEVHFTWDQAWIACDGGVQAFADSAWSNGKALLGDMKTMVSTLAGIDGRKVLVLAGAHLPEHPGRELALWATQIFMQHQDKMRTKLNITRAFGESGGRSQTLKITDAARFANANGVTFYMIDAADSRDHTGATASRMADDKSEEFMSFTDSAAAYKALADITGGSMLSNTQNFNAAFEALSNDLSSFYSIGYKPSEGSNADRKISVRAKKPGLNVRARKSYTPRTPDQDMNDRVIANVLHHGAKGEWPVTLAAQAPQKEGEMFKVPVTIEMDPKVTFIPQENKVVGGFVLYIVVGTREGAMSKVTKTTRKIEMPSAAESQFRSKPMTYTLMLSVRPGDNIISVGVVDQVSNVSGFARADVVAR
jgi:VWFA-related protein